MNLFELTRALVDIESITENELAVGEYLLDYLRNMAAEHGGKVETMPVAQSRFNVFAHWGEPRIMFSTHIDTVPPFFPSREDAINIWGRGACDTKGIIASMIFAIRELLDEGTRNIGLLLLVGEERNSAGAFAASEVNRGSKVIINGEPTDNKLALGSKGALRCNVIATGRMAHSAYPELGESAIEKLLDALAAIRQLELPVDDLLGRSTVNIGTIHGGRAPNVIPDHAQAEVFFRLVDDGKSTREALRKAIAGNAELEEVLTVPAVRLGSLPGFETTVVSFTTDIPAFGKNWGVPYLLGPGSIQVAHTSEEHISKQQLTEAVHIYKRMVRSLQ
ncbi:MAG: M20/M25/M40 family metallo-hydrolase [Bryobacteraceae bacterium]